MTIIQATTGGYRRGLRLVKPVNENDHTFPVTESGPEFIEKVDDRAAACGSALAGNCKCSPIWLLVSHYDTFSSVLNLFLHRIRPTDLLLYLSSFSCLLFALQLIHYFSFYSTQGVNLLQSNLSPSMFTIFPSNNTP